MPDELTEKIRSLLLQEGVELVGFADLERIPESQREGLSTGISFAVPLNTEIIEQLPAGPTKAYEAEYNRLNDLLGEIAETVADFLHSLGYRAIFTSATQSVLNTDTLATTLPHKTVATKAGLGWIGKCALLVTKEFGSAIRINSVLTDAPLTTSQPVTESLCGNCVDCLEICPADAPLGPNWEPSLDREEFFDAYACYETAKSFGIERGIKHNICGRCIAACPWTLKYLNRIKD